LGEKTVIVAVSLFYLWNTAYVISIIQPAIFQKMFKLYLPEEAFKWKVKYIAKILPSSVSLG
jgi:hypothetical protein